MRRQKLDGKVVLITGGARGIGRAVAAELGRRGARLVLLDADADALEETGRELRADAEVLTRVLDVTDYAACAAAVDAAVERFGGVDVVWANAGILTAGPVELADPAEWAAQIQVNVVGAYNTVRAALDAVIAARGHVALTASLASFTHAPALSAYCASKAAIEAFADSLRVEVRHQGVSVSSVHPGWIGTDMVEKADAGSAAFRVFRESLRPPVSRTYSVESVVKPIADSFESRSPRVYVPEWVRGTHLLRAVINNRVVLAEQVHAAPRIRAAYLDNS